MDGTVAKAKELIEQYHFDENCRWLLENLLLDTPLIDVEVSILDKPLTKLGWHTAHQFSVRNDVPVVDRTHTMDIWCHTESEYRFLRRYVGDYDPQVPALITLEVDGELVLAFKLNDSGVFPSRKFVGYDYKGIGIYEEPEPIFDWKNLEKLKLGRWIEDLDTIILDQKQAYSEKAVEVALGAKKRREQQKTTEEERLKRELAKKIDLGEYE